MDQKELTFKEETIKINFPNKSFDVRLPYGEEVANYTEKLEVVDKKNIREILKLNAEFLEVLGLPEEYSRKMSTKQTELIFGALTGN